MSTAFKVWRHCVIGKKPKHESYTHESYIYIGGWGERVRASTPPEPGNRFVSFVRACARACHVISERKMCAEWSVSSIFGRGRSYLLSPGNILSLGPCARSQQMHFRFHIDFTSISLSNSLRVHFDFTFEFTSISHRFHFRNELEGNLEVTSKCARSDFDVKSK